MYSPKTLAEPSDTVAAEAAANARKQRLTLYAGAGLSWSAPTSIPGARRIAQLIVDRLSSSLPFDGVAQDDLLTVADHVAAQERGAELLRLTVLEVANLRGAVPNYGHKVLALLICEGAATVFETNYDNCIERAAQPEMLVGAVSNADMLHGPHHMLLKAHGCADRPDTMLITSADLASTPLWAQAAVKARLTQDHFMFVGIGSVADYVRSSLEGVLEAAGRDHVLLVDPGLASWDNEDVELDWRHVLPGLEADQRHARAASEFLDSVLRAFTQEQLKALSKTVHELPEGHPSRAGVATIRTAFELKDSVTAVRWLRDATWPLQIGRGAVMAPVTTQGLCAFGTLLSDEWNIELRRDGWSRARPRPNGSVTDSEITSQAVDVATLFVADAVKGSEVAAQARVKVEQAKFESDMAAASDVVVLTVGAHTGSLGTEEVLLARGQGLSAALKAGREQVAGLHVDLLGDPDAENIVDGPRAGSIYFVNGAQIAVA